MYQDIERGVKSSLRSIEDVARMLEHEFADKLGSEGRRLPEIIRRSVDNLGGLIAALLQRKRQT